jgi:hypothetical protein
VLDETVIHRPISDRQLRKRQFRHLAELAEEPNITLPEFDGGPGLPYTEGCLYTQITGDPES